MQFYQSESNVVAHGMSSAEAAKYRFWGADPEYLQNPFDVAAEAAERRERIQRNMYDISTEIGLVATTDIREREQRHA